MSGWFTWFIFFWVFILVGFISIGGFFMFRKFLKVLPLADGKSKLDWQNHYVDASRHLWTDDTKQFLNVLSDPVPTPFRDIAKHAIAAKIGQLALEKRAIQFSTLSFSSSKNLLLHCTIIGSINLLSQHSRHIA